MTRYPCHSPRRARSDRAGLGHGTRFRPTTGLASGGVNGSVLDLGAVAAALALAAVLAVAGRAKVGDLEGTARDFAELGLPWPRPLARVVPAAELATALALVVLPGWGGVAAFGLLAAFSANLYVVIRSGRVVSCACFGANDRAPVSVRHLVRNGVLAGLALAATTFDGPIWSLW